MAERICTVDTCERAHYARGLCELHYARQRRHGGLHDKRAERTDAQERFWRRVVRGDGCWMWTGPANGSGYGSFNLNGRPLGAHVASVILDGRTIPPGMEVDHLCDTPLCVRPSHLRVVTRDVNWRRSAGPSARQARKTHCDHGHEFTPENTYRDSRGGRKCRACAAAYQRARRRANI